MAADDCRHQARAAALYGRAHKARAQSRALRRQVSAAQQQAIANCQQLQAWLDRAGQLMTMWPPGGGRDMALAGVPARRPARLQSQAVIEQAKGIIMAQYGWTAGQAFDALRWTSQRENIKVRELAATIVASSPAHAPSRPDPAPGQQEPPPADAEVLVLAAHRRKPRRA